MEKWLYQVVRESASLRPALHCHACNRWYETPQQDRIDTIAEVADDDCPRCHQRLHLTPVIFENEERDTTGAPIGTSGV